ncbi:MAG: type II toxin-antitoxin system Phd/YefM family antitoxin [Deltaproteobacteria bacterium]|nr:type II toxin-antitoxin system Phd/YefM family antitoxin [Deltaproteobacteria bacterium]
MAEAKASLSELAARTRGGERFRLLRRGKPAAALVAVEDLGRLDRAEAVAGFVAAARKFAASLPPVEELPDLADLLPERRTRPRQARRR